MKGFGKKKKKTKEALKQNLGKEKLWNEKDGVSQTKLLFEKKDNNFWKKERERERERERKEFWRSKIESIFKKRGWNLKEFWKLKTIEKVLKE